MKVADLITKVELQESRIKILEANLTSVIKGLEERPQLEARFDAQRELYKILEKSFEELELAHPTICKTDYSKMLDEPREVIPHEHEEDEK